MSAISLTTLTTSAVVVALALLVTAVGATVLGLTALRSARGLHRKVDALTAELERTGAASGASAPVPPARKETATEQIRAAVAEALAEERERELAEARAFWAAQESRDGDGPTLAGHGTEYEVAPGTEGPTGPAPLGSLGPVAPLGPEDLEAELLDALLEGAYDTPDGEVFIPRQTDDGDLPGQDEPGNGPGAGNGGSGYESELAAARRRHPSQPDFTLDGEPAEESPAPAPAAAPAVADYERTLERLGDLADRATPLADVRQGPLGTLDVYLFEDGTTVCLSPGHPETAERLCEALRRGDAPVLVGGSGISGAYTLTFTYGEGRIAYLLADRVIASL